MIIFGQLLDFSLSLLLVAYLVKLRLSVKYRAFLIFVTFDALASAIYLLYKWFRLQNVIHYGSVWAASEVISWITTLWVVYTLLIRLLEQLPGILRFSLILLNVVFGASTLIAVLTVGPEFNVSLITKNPLATRLTSVVAVIGRALSFAELVAILLIVLFVLFFPIRVPRNLAAFTTGISAYLIVTISYELLRGYVPGLYGSSIVNAAPGFMTSACLLYWLFTVNRAGEVSQTTVAGTWKALPQEQLVRQLEAMNAALLRSREQV